MVLHNNHNNTCNGNTCTSTYKNAGNNNGGGSRTYNTCLSILLGRVLDGLKNIWGGGQESWRLCILVAVGGCTTWNYRIFWPLHLITTQNTSYNHHTFDISQHADCNPTEHVRNNGLNSLYDVVRTTIPIHTYTQSQTDGVFLTTPKMIPDCPSINTSVEVHSGEILTMGSLFNACTLNACDAVWVLVLSMESADSVGAGLITDAMPSVPDDYSEILGMTLDDPVNIIYELWSIKNGN